MRPLNAARFALIALAPLLAGCGHKNVASKAVDDDAQSELQREQDCANPQWKAANLGLWYNLCPNDPF